jgi:hypothetical protein
MGLWVEVWWLEELLGRSAVSPSRIDAASSTIVQNCVDDIMEKEN